MSGANGVPSDNFDERVPSDDYTRDLSLLEAQWEAETQRLKSQLEETQEKARDLEQRASQVALFESKAAKLQYQLADEQLKVMDLQRERAELNESYLKQYLRAEGQMNANGDDMKERDHIEKLRELETNVDQLKYELADEKMKNMTLERRITTQFGQNGVEQLLKGAIIIDSPGTSSKENSATLEERRLQFQLADEQMKAMELEKEKGRETLRADRLQYELADLQLESLSNTPRMNTENDRHHLGSDDEDEQTVRMKKLEYALADEQMRVLELEKRRRQSFEMLQKTQTERDALTRQLSAQRARILEVDRERRDSIKEVYVWRQQAEILEENLHEAQEELQEAKLKTREVENQRRASISSLSQKMWNKLIEKQTEHDEESIHLAKRLQMVEEENARLRKSKMALILSTSQVIDELRQHILVLSNRLKQFQGGDVPTGRRSAPGSAVSSLSNGE